MKRIISLLLSLLILVSSANMPAFSAYAAVNKNISIVRIVRYKNSLKVKFKVKKTKKISGYQVQASTSKKFKKAKTKSVKVRASKRIAKVKKLKKNTKYFVRVRSYTKKKNGKVKYSKWSKVKSAKTLKVNKAGSKGTGSGVKVVNSKKVTQIIKNKIGKDENGDYCLYNNGIWFLPSLAVSEAYDMGWLASYSVSLNKYGSNKERQYVNEYLEGLSKIFIEMNLSENMSDLQKGMIISRWISKNIMYHYPDEDAWNAIIKGTTICAGYSSLLHDFLYLADIDSKVVVLSTDDGMGHAMVAIKLWDRWWLTETTCGSLYLPHFGEDFDEYMKSNPTAKTYCSYVPNCGYYGCGYGGLTPVELGMGQTGFEDDTKKVCVPSGTREFLFDVERGKEIAEATKLAENHKVKSRTEIIK